MAKNEQQSEKRKRAKEILDQISIDRYHFVSKQLDDLPIDDLTLLMQVFEADIGNIVILVLNYKLGRRQLL